MPSPDENHVLRILDEQGGECYLSKIAMKMGLSTEWAKTIIYSLGRRDFIDVMANGKCKLADKGWNTLGKRPTYDAQSFIKQFKEMKGR